jgi:hypothetical protein
MLLETLPCADKFTDPAYPSHREVCCRPVTAATTEDAEPGWLGIVRDASLCGITLALKRRFEPGAVLGIELATKFEGRRHFLVRVVDATPEKKGRWVIDCEFASPISREELQDFLVE